MTYQIGDVVCHSNDKETIGIITSDTNVEWWKESHYNVICKEWPLRLYKDYLSKEKVSIVRLQSIFPPSHNFWKSLAKFREGRLWSQDTDSPLVRKIKELDYKWELHMKKKGTFYLTSRAHNAEAGTTSQSTQTDTATASDANTTSPQGQQFRTSNTMMSQMVQQITTTGYWTTRTISP